MQNYLKENPMTAIMALLAFIVAIVGGGLVLFDSAGTLSYEDYIDALTKFAVGVGLLGIGRGIKKGLNDDDDYSGVPDDEALQGDYPGEAPRA